MLNPGVAIPPETLKVFDGIELPYGGINVGESMIVDHVRAAMRRQVPQMRQFQPNRDTVVLVGGGPSLDATFPELRELYFSGAKVVTLNGAYHWCLERNIRPSAQIVIDAQAHNLRFVEPLVPQCRYFIASQCHPSVWDAVEHRPDVWMLHAGCADEPIKSMLDGHFGGQWFNVPGGTTVATRALYALRLAGFLRFHVFGVDCCQLDGAHHAYVQPENDKDRMFRVRLSLGDTSRDFWCAPWHIKQWEDLLRIIKVDGDLFQMVVHGDGMLAWAVRVGADHLTGTVEDAPALALQGA